jgi:hypothetical protein
MAFKKEHDFMRVKSINNVDGFFKTLEICKGRVELITTDEKDVLNLASKHDTIHRHHPCIQQSGD